MNCPVCKKGKMVLAKDRFEEDRVEYTLYRCQHCGEEILDSEQLQALAEQYRALRKEKEIVFAKWGNSIAVRIPKDVAQNYGFKIGKHAYLRKEKEGIRIVPV